MKIELPLYQVGVGYSVVVPAEIVNVAPHLPADFAVHESAFEIGEWAVTEISTGARVPQKWPYYTKRQAIIGTRKYLADKSADHLAEAFKNLKKIAPEAVR